MKPTLSAIEIASELDAYVNDRGLFNDFKEYIEGKGYNLEEFGMIDEDIDMTTFNGRD